MKIASKFNNTQPYDFLSHQVTINLTVEVIIYQVTGQAIRFGAFLTAYLCSVWTRGKVNAVCLVNYDLPETWTS